MNAKHLSKSVELYTPPDVVDLVRDVIGPIQLDPASCPKANTIVRAKAIYTKRDDGLARPWFGKVLLNPPGGLLDGGASSARVWWEKLVFEFAQKRVTEAVFVAFSIEHLQRTQGEYFPSACRFPVCVPRKRIPFLVERAGLLVPAKDPTHANAIVYLGKRRDTFAQLFQQLGDVMLPYGGAL